MKKVWSEMGSNKIEIYFQEGIQELVGYWPKCIKGGEDYVHSTSFVYKLLFHLFLKLSFSLYFFSYPWFRGPDGKIAHNDRDSCHLITNTFENLISCESEVSFTCQHSPRQPSPKPPKEEVSDNIHWLKNNKALGDDSIMAELWKQVGDWVVSKLTEILQDILVTEIA